MYSFSEPTPAQLYRSQVSEEGLLLSSLAGFFLEAYKNLSSNIRRLNKHVVSTELRSWMDHHHQTPDSLYPNLRITARTPVLKPDGMVGRYTDTVPALEKAVRSVSMKTVAPQILKAFQKALSLVKEIGRIPPTLFDYRWDRDVLGSFYKDTLGQFLDDIDDIVKRDFRTPRPVVGHFSTEFPTEAALRKVVASALDASVYFNDLDDAQSILAHIASLSAQVVRETKQHNDIDVMVKERVIAFVTLCGNYFDYYGVALHELFRIDHNLFLTIDSVYSPKQ